MQNVEKLAVSVPEMAKMVGVSKCTAYEMIHWAGFPVVWIGKRAVIPVDGLKRWIEVQAAQRGATV